MTTSKIEKSSIDWKEIRRRYEKDSQSVRALAREFHTSDTAIHRKAEAGGWILFCEKPELQRGSNHGMQQVEKTPRSWSFETRRNALVTALERSRVGVDNVEDSYNCDALVVMALLWLRAPIPEICRAIEVDEVTLEKIYGAPIMKFWREYYPVRNKSPRGATRSRAGLTGAR